MQTKLKGFTLFDSIIIEVPEIVAVMVWNADATDLTEEVLERHKLMHCVYHLYDVQDLVDLINRIQTIDKRLPHKAMEILSALRSHLPSDLFDVVNQHITKKL